MATAIIGNSHAKTLKYAPNAMERNPLDARRYYFLRGGWRTEPAGPSEDGPLRLIALPQEEADEGLVLEGFDDLVLSAVGWWAGRNEVIEAGNHPLSFMACAGWGYDPERVAPAVRLVSAAAFDATVEAWVREQPIVSLARLLATVTPARIFLQPWPAPNRSLKSDPDWLVNRWYGERGPLAWRHFFLAQRAALEAVAAELGPRVVLLDYPVAEALEDGFMDASLCNPDPFHANEHYGALVVDQIAGHMPAQTAD
jgi:hypothetical protein